MAVINDDETPGVPLTGAGNTPVDSASQGAVLGILDITNPFYIHPSEHWGQNLVSTLLTEYNYSEWSMAISMVLDGKNKIGFVDGTIEAPDAGQPLYPYWIRNNKLVLSWILRSVSPTIAKSILYSKSARSAWVVLRSRFSQGDAFKIADLQEKVFALKQGTRSVTEFFTELITLYDELSNFRPLPDCACPPPCTCILSKIRTYHDQDRVIRFLRGLTDGFAGARSQVMLLDPLPSLDRVFAMMVQQERDQGGPPMEIFPSATDSQVMFTRAEASGRESSLSTRAPAFKRQGKRPVCTYCGYVGHTIDVCYKKNGYPPGYQPKARKVAQVHAVAAPLSSPAEAHQTSVQISPTEWSQFQQQYQRMVIAFQNSDGASTSQARPPTPQPNMARRSPSMIHEETREGQQLSRVNAAASRPHQDHITDPDSGKHNPNSSLILWILDSGASDHIVCSIKFFTTVIPINDAFVYLPNGVAVPATHRGNVQFSDDMMLTDVLLVPSFTFNLVSISCLSKASGLSLFFHNGLCVIQGFPHLKRIGTAKLSNGLYILQRSPSSGYHHNQSNTSITEERQPLITAAIPASLKHSVFSFSRVKHTIDPWHYRLGHIGSKCLQTLSRTNDTIQIQREFHCSICPCAKQKRLPFPTSSTVYTKPFQLVSMDIWGPSTIKSISGHNYFLTIVDAYTRYTWTFPIQHKSEVRPLVQNFFAYTKTQFNTTIGTIRTDNGREFLLPDFYASNGTIHHTTCVQTSQQNSLVERKHQHILAITRALLFQSYLPPSFWSHAINHAIHIINRSPTPLLQNQSPYETLYKQKPSYTHLRVFGCLCYNSTLSHGRSKLSPRATPSVFLGYPPNKKGFILYSLTNNSLNISRDVTFFENIFPYYKEQESHNIIQLPLPNYGISPQIDEFPNISISKELSSISPNNNSSLNSTNTDNQPSNIEDLPDSSSVISQHNDQPISNPPKRVSTRAIHKPKYLSDYKCNMIATRYPMQNILTYAKLSPRHQSFAMAITTQREPTTYTQAAKLPQWQEAIQKELKSLLQTKTWVLTEKPPGIIPISSKWVFRIKYKQDGSIDKYKARLVAKGYTQTQGLDYMDTFSPVVKMTTVRTLLAIAAIKGWYLEQLDVNTAFLHGDLDEDVYMKIPSGLSISTSDKDKVCKLNKSLYGLKQASRQWHAKLSQTLTSLGYTQSKSDYSLFTKNINNSFTALLVYVDDIILAGSDANEIKQVKRELDIAFTIKDLGPLKYFLGMEVARNTTGIHLCQRKYILDLLSDTCYTNCKPASTPSDPGINLSSKEGSPLDSDQITAYRCLLGRLQYLCTTRPDICQTVNHLSQFVSAPTTAHEKATHRLLRYLKNTAGHGLHFSNKSSFKIHAFSDSDWAGCPDSRRSVTGFCVFLGDSLISWKSKKQPTVSRSSTEAEYRALASTAAELQWLHGLISNFPINIPHPYKIYCDNLSAVKMTENPIQHERTKHIELDCHFIRDKVLTGFLKVQHISTHNQLADPFTKSLPVHTFQNLISKLNLESIHA